LCFIIYKLQIISSDKATDNTSSKNLLLVVSLQNNYRRTHRVLFR
jgi:hypothetical protein